MSVFSDQDRRRYWEDGFIRVEQYFSESEVTELENEITRFIEDEAPLLEGREINYVDPEKKVLNSIHRLHRTEEGFFTKFMKSPKVLDVAKELFDHKAEPRAAELFAKPAEAGLMSPAHQDNYYWCIKDPAKALTIWVALDPSSRENGGVYYLSGSHKLGLVEHKPSNAPGSSQVVADFSLFEKYDKVVPELKRGDVLVHDSYVIHGSESNQSTQSRRGITFQLQQKGSETDLNRQNSYVDSLKKQISER